MLKKFNKEDIKKILDSCLTTGADFGEVFIENTTSNYLEMTNGEVSKALSGVVNGVGIRILKGIEEVYGYTNSLEINDMIDLAKKLASSFNGEAKEINYELVEKKAPKVRDAIEKPCEVLLEVKSDILYQTYLGAKEYSDEIKQVISRLNDVEQYVLIANTKGTYVYDYRPRVRLSCMAVAKNDKDTEYGFHQYGMGAGYEIFKDWNGVDFGRETAKDAVKMLYADEIAGGKMTVVVHNGFGGVLLHEACVHALEATSVAKGTSVFCGKLGQKIASDIVTAIDDGTIPNEWGSINVDDEGNESKKNVLIENGILKSYLVDYRNSLKMNTSITGSARRQSYKYSPTSRMTNTFFAPGESSFEEIIAATEHGFFAMKMGGGSVNPATGEFNFAVSEGYLIENGKITKPIKGATLVGSGAEILMNIDMIAKENLALETGMCGSLSGSVPTTVGQPTIRVQNITVGGRGK